MNLTTRFVALALFFCAAGVLHADPSSIVIKGGQKIGFLGDSITAQGAGPDGYITLVMAGLKAEGVEATAVPAGVPGHTSGNMRGRVDHDVLSKNVDWMTLSCGVNDVALQAKGHGVDLEKFKSNVTAILDAAQAKNVKVIVLTATPNGEDFASPNNTMLDGYNQFLRDTVKARGLVLADVNAAFKEFIAAHPGGPVGTPGPYNKCRLLADGIHPNFDGQHLMAETVLQAMGVAKEDLPKAEEAWPKTPTPRQHKAAPAPASAPAAAPATAPATNAP